ncbi:MAG TPA: FAD-dependent oxidoreductase, partial [Syntrophomonas sp.]|nr:NAD(P)/FAD-dependent oxidoreductase [Bacillota bacterium]HAA09188.1 FAD-dependent oxidoreductase [Syntrophomonas sp.]
MVKTFDVIIVGAGPAGIFAAMEICRHTNLKILMLEKGKTVQKRCCPIGEDTPSCINCKPCSIMSGWGGAGAFSDGKLTLTTEFGGWLHNYMSKEKLQQLIAYVDQTYVDHGAPDRLFGQDNDKVQELMYRVARAGLRLIPAQIRHMGTENTLQVLSNMYKDLESRVTIKTGETVQDILVEGDKATGVTTNAGTYYAPKIILAPGRDGAHWFTEQATRLGLTLHNNQVDLGVRVEVPAVTMQEFTDNIWEPKIVYNTRQFDDIVRT